MTPDHSALFDWSALASGVAAVILAYAPFLDTIEKLAIGALAILLLVLRVRSHLRRDAAERKNGQQL